MPWSRIGSLFRHVAGFGVRQSFAVLTLCTLTAALAGPLLGPALGGDATYCCRSGRCCCDSGKDSPEGLDLKTACRCARPDGTAIAFAVPLGLVAPGPALLDPGPTGRLAPRPLLTPQDGRVSPPEEPPRLSSIT